jgi:hypothetical protein
MMYRKEKVGMRIWMGKMKTFKGSLGDIISLVSYLSDEIWLHYASSPNEIPSAYRTRTVDCESSSSRPFLHSATAVNVRQCT